LSIHLRHIAGLVGVLWVLVTGVCAGEIYPPHQFRLTDPTGPVEVRGAGGKVESVDARASLAKGDVVRVGKKAFANIRIAQIGSVYLREGTILKVQEIEKDGRPILRVLEGTVLLKTRAIGGVKPIEIFFGTSRLRTDDGMVEIRYLKARKMAAVAPLMGTVKVRVKSKSKDITLPAARILVRDDGKMAKKRLDKKKVRKRWEGFGPTVLDPGAFPTMADEAAPVITVKEPKNGATLERSRVTISGTVDDLTIKQVKVSVNKKYRSYANVNGGRFGAEVELRAKEQLIQISAQDAAKNLGEVEIKLRCKDPAPEPPPPVKPDKSLTGRVRRAIRNPAKDPEMIAALAVAGFVSFLIIFLLIRWIVKRIRGGAEVATGLATGVIFNRCEACGERQYEYHLFYTEEPVTSPFMRNLINNVNPMATSIMNESLENLLNSGLQGSAGAKGADQKIRVTCTWCDQCKVGNLKLEHMRGKEVFKTDDYQIIHPIFIEWVRKVYD
jgi:hypothetical protein